MKKAVVVGMVVVVGVVVVEVATRCGGVGRGARVGGARVGG